MRKFPVLLFLLFICSLNLISQNLKKVKSLSVSEELIPKIENEYIKVIVDNVSGKFSILTSKNQTLLYFDSTRSDLFTSHLNFKLDSNIFSNEVKIAEKALTDPLRGVLTFNKNSVEIFYSLKNNISLVQRLTPVTRGSFGGVLIECFVNNNDSIPHKTGLLYEFDTQINSKDGSPFKTNLGTIYNDNLFHSNIPLYWQSFDQFGSDNSLIGTGYLKGTYNFNDNSNITNPVSLTPPDYIFISDWEKLFNILWDYKLNIGEKYFDGGMALRWDERTIQPYSTQYYSTYIGKGEEIIDGVLSSSISLPQPYFTGSIYSPNPLQLSIDLQNTGDDTIYQASTKIEIPEGLTLKNYVNPILVEKIFPNQSVTMVFPITVEFTNEELSLPINIEICALNQPKKIFHKIVHVPPAPGIDFLRPVFEIAQKSCDFSGLIRDDRLYDSGIDSVKIDFINNLDFNYKSFIPGESKINIDGRLLDILKPGFALLHIRDRSGNITQKEIRIIPYTVGFDSSFEVTPGKRALIPLKFINFQNIQSDTSFSFTVSFDTNSLSPNQYPFITSNSQSSFFRISKSEITGNHLTAQCVGNTKLTNGILINLNFLVKNNAPDSTNLILENFILNDDRTCFNRINTIIRTSISDSMAPAIQLRKSGNKIFCRAIDSSRNDKGIYSLNFFYSQNAKFKYSQFTPGSKIVEFTLECVDTLDAMNGVLSIMDGGGNIALKYFENNPIKIYLDTLQAKVFEDITITPKISKPVFDSLITGYEFRLEYNTNVMRPTKPFYDSKTVPNNSFTIKFDTVTPGIIYVKASNYNILRSGDLIKLFFKVQPGKDTSVNLNFRNFFIDEGETFSAPHNSIIRRKSNDYIPPEILTEQKGRTFSINILEKQKDDIGIQKVLFTHMINIDPQSTGLQSYFIDNRTYLIQLKDTTQDASISITALDFAGNISQKEMQIKPIKLSLPENLFGKENDTVFIPLRLSNYRSLPLKNIKFTIEYDPMIVNPERNSYTIPKGLLDDISVNLSETPGRQAFQIEFMRSPDKIPEIFLHLNYRFIKGQSAQGRITISSPQANNDSLYLYGTSTTVKRYFQDTLSPQIYVFQTGCEITAIIKDSRKEDSRLSNIWLDSLMNFKDTILYSKPFLTGDSTALIRITPINSKNKSSAFLNVLDNENNLSRRKIEIKPLSLKFPQKILTDTTPEVIIPLYMDFYEDQLINDIDLEIKYDNELLEYKSISLSNTMLTNSIINANIIDRNTIAIKIKPKINKLYNTLLFLYFSSTRYNKRNGQIIFQKYSFNSDSLCVNAVNGNITKSVLDTIIVSIDTIRGKIGSTVSIPIKLDHYPSNIDIKSYRAVLNFNGTLLNPISFSSRGTVSEGAPLNYSKKETGYFVFQYSGDPYLQPSSVLNVINSKVLLGTETGTSIKIDSILFYIDTTLTDDRLCVFVRNGFFKLDSLSDWQKGLTLKGNYLAQNHPNPYNFSTSIMYRIGNRSYVKLKIFDILGRIIDEPVSSIHEAGTYTFTYNANSLPSGIYFYRIENEYFSQIRKMILMK